MEDSPYLFARDLTELNAALQLIPRDGGACVDCSHSQSLQCPVCPEGTSCQYTVPTNCQSCSKAVCQADVSSSNGGGGSGSGGGGGSGPNVGAIAGGVLGGVAVIALVSYLVWRFLVKPKRSPQGNYMPQGVVHEDGEKDNASRMTRRSSTHTVHSIASTVLTRASNIIQIAYIPGVTNRATPTSPDSPAILVPPVPPIPAQHAQGKHQSSHTDQHFFVPSDLRYSTYSAMSGQSDRTSYAPRSSIASTIYGRQAQIAAPAQTGMRAKPTMVSVRSAATSEVGSQENTPPVPNIDFDRFGSQRPKSGASAFSVGSTFLNNANTATQARAQVIKVGGGLKRIAISSKSDTSVSVDSLPASPPAPSPNRSTRESGSVTAVEDSPAVDQGPFSDPPLQPAAPAGLETVAEDQLGERSPRSIAPSRPSSGGREYSPFGDEHAAKE